MKSSIFTYVLVILLLSAISYSSVPDSDQDGVADEDDNCPDSGTNVVDQFGCSCSQKGCVSDDNPCTDDCGTDDIGRIHCNIIDDTNTCPRGVCERGECKASLVQRDIRINPVVVQGEAPTSYRGDCRCGYENGRCKPCPPTPVPFPGECRYGRDPSTGRCKTENEAYEDRESEPELDTVGYIKDIVDYLKENKNSKCTEILGFGAMSKDKYDNFIGRHVYYVTGKYFREKRGVCKENYENYGGSIIYALHNQIYICESWIQGIRQGKILDKELEFLQAITYVNDIDPTLTQILDACFGGDKGLEYKPICRFNERDSSGNCPGENDLSKEVKEQLRNDAHSIAIQRLERFDCSFILDGKMGRVKDILSSSSLKIIDVPFPTLGNPSYIASVDRLGAGKDGTIYLSPLFYGQDFTSSDDVVYKGLETDQDRARTLLHEGAHLAMDPDVNGLLHGAEPLFGEITESDMANDGISASCNLDFKHRRSSYSILGPVTEPFCTDSDGRNSYETAGTVQSNSNSAQDCCTNGNNECLSESSYVKEYFCNNNEISYELYQCPQRCSDGRCIVQYPNPASPTLIVTPTQIENDEVRFHVSSESPNSEVLVQVTDSSNNVIYDNQLIGNTDQNGNFDVTINQDDTSSWQPDNYEFRVNVNGAQSNEVTIEVQPPPATECDLNCPGPNGWAYWGPPYTGGCGECGTVLRWCDENCQHTEQYTCVDEGCP